MPDDQGYAQLVTGFVVGIAVLLGLLVVAVLL